MKCLIYALEGEEFGVWGGLNDRQRRKIKKAGTPKSLTS